MDLPQIRLPEVNPVPRMFIATVGESSYEIPESGIREWLDRDGMVAFHPSLPGTELLVVRRGGKDGRVYVRPLPDGSMELWMDRYRVVVGLQDERHRLLSAFIRAALEVRADCSVKAPMPGLIREIAVRTGDVVRKGQRLVILEAMKMENEISAPVDGTVGACRLTTGVNVDKDEVLLHIIPSSGH